MNMRVDFDIAVFQLKASFTLIISASERRRLDAAEIASHIYRMIAKELVIEYEDIIEPDKPSKILVILSIPALCVKKEQIWDVSGEDWQDMDAAKKKSHIYTAVLRSLTWSCENP